MWGLSQLAQFVISPPEKKLPCKWFVWLSEVSLKPVLEAEQFYLLDLGWRRVRGCPKDVPTSAVTVQRETSGFRFLVPALSPAPPFWNKHQEDLPPQLCCCQAFHWYFLMKTGDTLWIYTLGIQGVFPVSLDFYFFINWRNKTVVAIVNSETSLIVTVISGL